MGEKNNVAVIGAGVIGLTTTLEFLNSHPNAKVTVFYDRPFEEICSAGPAGLFRVDSYQNREYGRVTFQKFAEIYKKYGGDVTGLKLLSGHIQSDDKEPLIKQEQNDGDIVLNFRWLDERESKLLFTTPPKHCVHLTTFASEGGIYVPFLRKLCVERGVYFQQRKIDKLEELSNFDLIFNCTGIDGGKIAGDDNSITPVRGVVLELDAPWIKHFNYKNFDTIVIPKNNSLMLGVIKEEGDSKTITEKDRQTIWDRYLKLDPTLKGAKVIGEWCNLRPCRPTIRIEKQTKTDQNGKKFTVIHNYGHGPNGFTLSWGTAQAAVQLLETKSKL